MKDESPYVSRETLFEMINRRDAQIDNLMAENTSLKALFEAQSEKITLEPDLDSYEQELPA